MNLKDENLINDAAEYLGHVKQLIEQIDSAPPFIRNNENAIVAKNSAMTSVSLIRRFIQEISGSESDAKEDGTETSVG